MISAVVNLIYIIGIPIEILVINTEWHGQVMNHVIHQSPAGKSLSTLRICKR